MKRDVMLQHLSMELTCCCLKPTDTSTKRAVDLINSVYERMDSRAVFHLLLSFQTVITEVMKYLVNASPENGDIMETLWLKLHGEMNLDAFYKF